MLHKLRVVNAEFDKLIVIQPPRCFGYGDRIFKYLRIGPDGELTPEAIQKVVLFDEHSRAIAHYRSWMRSRAGQSQLRRLTREQWAAHRHRIAEYRRLFEDPVIYPTFGGLVESMAQELFSMKQWQIKADQRYVYDRYTSVALKGEGVDLWDWELLQWPLGIRVQEKEDIAVKESLDPRNKGYIRFQPLSSFLDKQSELQHPHRSIVRLLTRGLVMAANAATNRLYRYRAQEVVVVTMRTLMRTKLQFLKRLDEAYAEAQGKVSKVSLIEAAPTVHDPMQAPFSAGQAGSVLAAEERAEALIQLSLETVTHVIDTVEDAELRMLCRMAEDKAERQCWQHMLFTRRGRQCLWTERILIVEADRLVASHGYLIPPGVSFPWTVKVQQFLSKWRCKLKFLSGVSDSDLAIKTGRVDSPTEPMKEAGWLDDDQQVANRGVPAGGTDLSVKSTAGDHMALDGSDSPKRVVSSSPAAFAVMGVDGSAQRGDDLTTELTGGHQEELLKKEEKTGALDDEINPLQTPAKDSAVEPPLVTTTRLNVGGNESGNNNDVRRQGESCSDGIIGSNGSDGSNYTPAGGADAELHTKGDQFSPIQGIEDTEEEEGNEQRVSVGDDSFALTKHDLGWDVALSVLALAFDTDCSGNFDEGEVRLLLDCVFCHLPERKVLFHFPDVRMSTCELEQVLLYLTSKVRWRRGWFGPLGSCGELSITKRSSTLAAALLLVSRNRQDARDATLEATTLVRTGQLLEEKEIQSEHSLIVRSQLIAMRQVRLFLRTTFGRLHRKAEQMNIQDLWKSIVVSGHYSLTALLRFTYQLHKDPRQGLLVTELPNLIRYVVTVLGLKTNGNISSIAALVSRVTGRLHLQSFSESEAVMLLENVFGPPPSSAIPRALWRARLLLRRSFNDARYRVEAIARQQAVLLSMRFSGALVAETNYRCSILGMYSVLDSTQHETTDENVVKIKVDGTIDWYNTPREALTLLLLSRGFSYRDLFRDPIESYAGVDHSDGSIRLERTNVEEALECATESNIQCLTGLAQMERWLRFFGGISKYFEYKQVVTVLSQNENKILSCGAMFLNELLTGTSHCSFIDGD